jgi:hypothetical protein
MMGVPSVEIEVNDSAAFAAAERRDALTLQRRLTASELDVDGEAVPLSMPGDIGFL